MSMERHVLETVMEKCRGCGGPHWMTVPYCPYCGLQMDAASAEAAPRAEPAASQQAALPVVDNDRVPPQTVVEPPTAAPTAPTAPTAPSPAPPQAPKSAPTSPPVAAAKTAPPQATQSDEKPQGGGAGAARWKLVLGAGLACALAYGFLGSKTAAPDACDQALAQGQSAMQQNDAQAARQQAQTALAACRDSARARLAKAADDAARALLATQAQAQARAEQQQRQLAQQQRRQQSACENANRQTAKLLQSGQLESAGRSLQRADPACRDLGETQALIAQFDGMHATAGKAATDARAQLAQGALAQARTNIEVLASVNRESAELPQLRAALNKAQPAAAAVAAPASSAQNELLRGFLRDAEASMEQRLYDKAKTYAESAQRIDPRNPEVARLLRRIKEHEMSYLRERIVIE